MLSTISFAEFVRWQVPAPSWEPKPAHVRFGVGRHIWGGSNIANCDFHRTERVRCESSVL